MKREFLRWKRGHPAAPFHFLDYQYGQGEVITGERPEPSDTRVAKPLSGPDVLAVNTLGTLAENPRVIALRDMWSTGFGGARQEHAGRAQDRRGFGRLIHPHSGRSG